MEQWQVERIALGWGMQGTKPQATSEQSAVLTTSINPNFMVRVHCLIHGFPQPRADWSIPSRPPLEETRTSVNGSPEIFVHTCTFLLCSAFCSVGLTQGMGAKKNCCPIPRTYKVNTQRSDRSY